MRSGVTRSARLSRNLPPRRLREDECFRSPFRDTMTFTSTEDASEGMLSSNESTDLSAEDEELRSILVQSSSSDDETFTSEKHGLNTASEIAEQ